MVLAASEDKLNRGAHIASPSMPWAWGLLTIEKPSAAYHLVWPRDLYQVATAQHALGDSAAANRLLDFTFERQQKPDGSFPQNTRVDGAENWTNLQMDEVALPIVLAWQLRRFEPDLYENHVKKAADFIAENGPFSPQERWENQSGWSPGTIAAEIAGLVCAADVARRNGDPASAERWELVADEWESQVDAWTATSNGPYDPKPYYLRLDGAGAAGSRRRPPIRIRTRNGATRWAMAALGCRSARGGRPSFLELVRLGVKPHDHETRSRHPPGGGRAARRGHPERALLAPLQLRRLRRDAGRRALDLSDPDTFETIGRIWPIFAGERGEYELLAGDRGAAASRLASMAGAAGEGWMIPEQVWDENPPSGSGFPRGEGTLSATPLAWSHAQFIRLAWSLDAGRPVEQPRVVACRYAVDC